jgi:hypothetical protein
MNKMFADREQLGSQSHHGIMGDLHSAQLTSPSETFLREGFPTPKIALIHGKTTLMFSKYSILLFIWLIRDRIDAENHR